MFAPVTCNNSITAESADDYGGSGCTSRRWRWLFILGAAVVLLVLVSVVIRWERRFPAPQREFRADGIEMRRPASMAQLEVRNLGNLSSVIFGEKDDCSGYFLRFLGVSWSKDDIATKQILPSAEYKIQSESGAGAIRLGSDRSGSLTELVLTIRKPCGQVQTHRLSIIRFKLAQTGQQFAVAGFIEPFLSQDVLIATARSITRSVPYMSHASLKTIHTGVRHGSL